MSRQDESRKFIQQAESAQRGMMRESWGWLRHNKKWWLMPIVLALFVAGTMVMLSSTVMAPFLYTLF